jgi:ankyrin repeat protein
VKQAAIDDGYLKILEYLESKHPISSGLSFLKAASRGHVHMIQYAHERGLLRDDDAASGFNEAAKNGHLEVIRFLDGCYITGDKKFNVSDDGFSGATYNNHMEVVKYLLDHHRCEECDIVRAFGKAVEGLNFEIAKFLWSKDERLQGTYDGIGKWFADKYDIDFQFYDLLRDYLSFKDIYLPARTW